MVNRCIRHIASLVRKPMILFIAAATTALCMAAVAWADTKPSNKASQPPVDPTQIVAPGPGVSPNQAAANAQIQKARDRLAITSHQPHPGKPTPLAHPDADHAGSGLSARSPVRKPPAPQFNTKVGPNASTDPTQPGLDVSSYQGNVDWAQVRSNGAQFAYSKATEGTSYKNPYFGQQYNGSYNVGMVRGAYHFATPNTSSGPAQADFFVANGGGWSADNHTTPGMVDLEYNPYGSTCYGLNQSQMADWMGSFSNEYHALTGRWPAFYTTTDWWKTCTGNNPGFGANPLWIANWSSSPFPLPNGWSNWTIWQYADSGIYPGDQDSFNGNYNQLVSFANGQAPPPPPPPAPSPPPPAPGSTIASSNQFGMSSQTDVFTVGNDGSVQVSWVTGTGRWSAPMPISPPGTAPSGAHLVASNQFGLDTQTDLFFVANDGSIQVLWVVGDGRWNGPMPVSPPATAPAGANIAASNQFGSGAQTDVFTVGSDGATRVSWVAGSGRWNGPMPITRAGTSPGGAGVAVSNQFGLPTQTDVFSVGSDGANRVSWVVGAGTWGGPMPITPAGTFPAGARLAASNQFGLPSQTDVFAVGGNGASRVSWVEGQGTWGGPMPITPAGSFLAGAPLATSNQFGLPSQTDVFGVGGNGTSRVSWVVGSGTWNGSMPITAGIAPDGSDLSASQQFGIANQTDVFLVGNDGSKHVSWVQGDGSWMGPQGF
jgi:GH25 family lysozyme M1 (1,4-beta-N-acetylmuramidase)